MQTPTQASFRILRLREIVWGTAVMSTATVAKNNKKQIKQLQHVLSNANTYSEWRTTALKLDVLQDNDLWRAKEEGSFSPP